MYREKDTNMAGQTGECVVSDLHLRKDLIIRVENSGVGSDNQRKTLSGRARVFADPSNATQLKLEIKYNAFSPWQSFKVLDTDYLSYAIVHSCSVSLGAWTYEDTQVLVRDPNEIGTRPWHKVNNILPGGMKHAFTDKDKAKEMSRMDDESKYEAVVQGGQHC